MAKNPKLPSLEWFAGRANVLIDANDARDKMLEGIDNMVHQVWEKDEQLDADQIHPYVSPEFALADEAASRILADPDPRITLAPYGEDSADIVDQHEKALKWLLFKAGRRRIATIVEDVVRSAHRYAEVVAEVIYLPEQIANVKEAGGNARRYENALRAGEFIIEFHHPKAVHPRYSSVGLEEVLLREEQDPHAIIDLYGTKADELKIAMTSGDDWKKLPKVWFCKYINWDHVCIWVETAKGGKRIELAREANKRAFFSWVCKIGGTSLESASDHQRHPILYNAYHNKQFDLMNKIRTLRISDVFRYASHARRWFQSDTREQPDMDASNVDPALHLFEDEKIGELSPPVPDPQLGQMHAELRTDLEKSTVSSILLGSGNIPAGAAFSSINLVTHSALAVVKQPRRLAEDALAEILEKMLLFIHYASAQVVAYGKNKQGERETYMIKGEDIDPANIYLTVELTADLPTDRQARMITAQAGIQTGLLDRRTAREDIGITDSAEVEESIIEERVADSYLQSYVTNMQRRMDEQTQQQMLQQAMQIVQQQMQQQAMQQQQMQQQQQQPGMMQDRGLGPRRAPPPNPQQGVRGVQGIQGPLTDPAAGGAIPAELSPGITRETQTGTSAGGEEIASV